MDNGNRLKFKIELARGPIAAASRRFWHHPRLCELFPNYLFHLHCAMRAAAPLIEIARDRASTRREVGGEILEAYLGRHLEEEREHADWLLEDMSYVGCSAKDTLSRPPPTCIAELIGTQYYWSLHVHPVTLLSYFAVLEGNPVSPEFLEASAKAASIPMPAMRTLLLHAEEDQAHRDDLFDTLDRIPLDGRWSSLLGVNAIQVSGQLARVFRELVSEDA